VEEVDRKHAGGLRAQELPPTRIGLSRWRRWDPVALEDPTDRRGGDAVAELEQFALDPAVSQLGFSVAIRTTSATMMSLIGGRPGRFG
jgi:hypothetical protein